LKTARYKDFSEEYKKFLEESKAQFHKDKRASNQKVGGNKATLRKIITNDVDKNAHSKDGVLVITIKDTGIGIKDEDITKLFQPFVQINSASKIQGSGLGLWISNQLILAMNGQISLKSKFNLGTTFKVIIPSKVNFHRSFKGNALAPNLSKVNDGKHLLFSPIISPYSKISTSNFKTSYILVTYFNSKDKFLIDELFINEDSCFSFNRNIKIYDYEIGFKVIQEQKEMINSIILFSTSQFITSLYYINKIRESEKVHNIQFIPILIVGNENVKNHENDFRNFEIKNFVYDIFSIQSIAREYKIMIKQQM